MGSSNVPGTYRTMMFSSLHPHSRSVLTAPSRSALVTSGFHSETTMPNFISAAEGSGASKCERFLVAIVQIVLFSVRISPQVSSPYPARECKQAAACAVQPVHFVFHHGSCYRACSNSPISLSISLASRLEAYSVLMRSQTFTASSILPSSAYTKASLRR